MVLDKIKPMTEDQAVYLASNVDHQARLNLRQKLIAEPEDDLLVWQETLLLMTPDKKQFLDRDLPPTDNW